MYARRRFRLVVTSVAVAAVAAAASMASGASASVGSTTPGVAVDARFVVFDRPYSGTPNLGPIDLAELFHPGGIGGGENLPCTPDRLDILQNEVTLTFDPDSLEVTGTAGLLLTCQFHFGEGCRPEERSVDVEFDTGLLDPITLQALGTATISAPDRVTQNWGNAGVGDPSSCTWGDISLGGVGPYELSWRLDLTHDPAAGFFAADVVAGDPAQRVGAFEVSNPESVGRVLAAVPAPATPAEVVGDAPTGTAAGEPVPAGGGSAAAEPTASTAAGPLGVFAPSADDKGSTANLWIAFFLLFVLLAAVVLYGRPATRLVRRMLNR